LKHNCELYPHYLKEVVKGMIQKSDKKVSAAIWRILNHV